MEYIKLYSRMAKMPIFNGPEAAPVMCWKNSGIRKPAKPSSISGA